jgi:hypothetical protein
VVAEEAGAAEEQDARRMRSSGRHQVNVEKRGEKSREQKDLRSREYRVQNTEYRIQNEAFDS